MRAPRESVNPEIFPKRITNRYRRAPQQFHIVFHTSATVTRTRDARATRTQIALNSSNGCAQLRQTWMDLQAVAPNSLLSSVSVEPQ
jgi:hypothetical protein